MKHTLLLPILVLVLLIGSGIAWKEQRQKTLAERDDLPLYITTLVEKGKLKKSWASKQTPYVQNGSNVVLIFAGDEGDFCLLPLSGEKELYVHKNL